MVSPKPYLRCCAIVFCSSAVDDASQCYDCFDGSSGNLRLVADYNRVAYLLEDLGLDFEGTEIELG